MSGQYFGERVTTPEIVEGSVTDTNIPVVNSDIFADRVPVDASLVHETPMGGTVAAVGPIDEPLAEEVPMFETPIQEIPMGGTVSAVGPIDEPLANDYRGVEAPVQVLAEAESVAEVAPLDEAIVSAVPIIGALPYIAPVNATVAEKIEELEPVPYKTADEPHTVIHDTPVDANPGLAATLLTPQESEHFRTSWNEIQGKFVDEPRSAVQQADTLVSEVIGQITQMFAKEHSLLEGQWNQGNDVSTEDLRKALQRYRSFFNRLVV
jgi:hypothetical protein